MCTSSNGGRPPIPPNSNKPNLTPSSAELPIIQAQMLLNTLEKELKRDLRLLRYFYAQHFPELTTVIQNDSLYSRVVRRIGRRQNILRVNLSDLLTPAEIAQVVNAANNTVGDDITDEEIEDVYTLCNRISRHINNLACLEKIIEIQMQKMAPYLTGILGAKLGARTIYRASILLRLAQQQASRLNGSGGDEDNAGEGPSRGLGAAAAGAVNGDLSDEDDEQLAPKQGAEEDADDDSD